MRIKKLHLALALPAMLSILLGGSDAAFAQYIVLSNPNDYNVWAIDTNDTLVQTIVLTNDSGGACAVGPVAADFSGNLYVAYLANLTNGAVAKFGPDLRLLNKLFISGLPANPPSGLSVDPAGYFYVMPTNLSVTFQSPIWKYDSFGALVSTNWGKSIGGLAGGANGNVYAVGAANSALDEYDDAGNLITHQDFLAQDNFIVADRVGDVLVPVTNSVSKYDSNLNFITNYPAVHNTGVFGLDDRGTIYVPTNSVVNVYDTNGNFLRSLPDTYDVPHYIAVQTAPQLSVATNGNKTVAFWTPPFTNYLLQSITNPASTNWLAVTNGSAVAGVTVTNGARARFLRLSGLAKNIFVSDYNLGETFVYSINGTQVGTVSSGDSGMAIDFAGNVYVATFGSSSNGTIAKYGPDLSLINPNFISCTFYPGTMAIDAMGNIYVAPSLGDVSKYDSLGTLITTNCGSSDFAVACGLNGNIYTSWFGELLEYNAAGQLIQQNDSVDPGCIAVDGSGNVFIWDYNIAAVRKLDPALNEVASYSVPGNNASASGIAVDDRSDFYLANLDGGASEYDPNGNLLMTIPGPDPDNKGGYYLALQPSPPRLNIANAGNQSVLYWKSSMTNYVAQSVTNTASTNWQAAADAAPCLGVVMTNAPVGSIYRLTPAQ